MSIRYYIDERTNLPHIYKHDITKVEVEEVLNNPGEDRIGKDESRVCIGQTSAGRYLKIIYVQDKKKNELFVITAYEIKGKALLAYKRRRRKKYGK
jgi:hypothetical protein